MTDRLLTSNEQCAHTALAFKIDKAGMTRWHCANCLRTLNPSGDMAIEQALVLARADNERLRWSLAEVKKEVCAATPDWHHTLRVLDEALSGDSSASETGDERDAELQHYKDQVVQLTRRLEKVKVEAVRLSDIANGAGEYKALDARGFPLETKREPDKVACGDPVMINAEWYGPCTLPSGHEGDCKRAPKATSNCSGCRNGFPIDPHSGFHRRIIDGRNCGFEACTAQNGKGDGI